MRKSSLALLLAVLVLFLAGCEHEEKKAERIVYDTLASVLTIKDRPLSSTIVDITYEHTRRNWPWQKTAYYIKGYVTVRRVALKDFTFKGRTVHEGEFQEYKYYYEAKVVKGVKHELVLLPSGLAIKKVGG